MKLTKTIWTKLFAIGLGATMALGVSISIHYQSDVIGAKAVDTYNEQVISFATNPPATGWTTDGTFNSTYYKMSSGNYAVGTAESLFGSDKQLSSANMVVNVACGTFGTWSGLKSVNVLVQFLNASGTQLTSATATYTGLNSTQTTYRGEITLAAPADPSQIANLKVTFTDFTTGPTLRFAGLKLTYQADTPTPADVLNSIEVKTLPQQNFVFASTFNTTGLVITANYQTAGLVDLTEGFTVTGVNTMVLGEQTATVSFGGKQTTYTVTVTNEGFTPLFAQDLFFSEYLEGSSNNKAIEIYNGTGESVELSDYRVELYSNGSTVAGNTLTFTEGTILPHGDVYIIANSDSNATILGMADVTSTVTYFNGDDAIALVKVSDSSYVDIFGEIGYDPGSSWSSSGVTTVDKTLVRKSTVKSGVKANPAEFYPGDEWIQYNIDDTSNLGSHTMFFGIIEQATAFANYVNKNWGLTSESSYAQINAVLTELNLEYEYMDPASKTIFDSGSGNYATARIRCDCLEAWANSLNGGGGALIINNEALSRSTLIWAATIGLIGITTIAGFYFLKKKKETF